jgi:hypothetical protein
MPVAVAPRRLQFLDLCLRQRHTRQGLRDLLALREGKDSEKPSIYRGFCEGLRPSPTLCGLGSGG